MNWSVFSKKKVAKQVVKLPVSVKEKLYALMLEMEIDGPVRGNWPNYGKLGTDLHHCHLKKGNPTYVAVWAVLDNRIKLIEVIFVGSHEKAPY